MLLSCIRKVCAALVLVGVAGCGGERAPPTPAAMPPEANPAPARTPEPTHSFEVPLPVAGPAVVEDPYPDVPLRKPIIHRALAGKPGPDGWCLAESTRGKFSVEMPGQFGDSMFKMTTTTGGIGAMHTVARKTPEGTEFNVLKTEMFGKLPEPINMPENIAKGFESKGATVTRQQVTIAGMSGVRLSVRITEVAAEIVLLDTPGRSYVLGVQWRTKQPATFDQDVERFFHSFKPLMQ